MRKKIHPLTLSSLLQSTSAKPKARIEAREVSMTKGRYAWFLDSSVLQKHRCLYSHFINLNYSVSKYSINIYDIMLFEEISQLIFWRIQAAIIEMHPPVM